MSAKSHKSFGLHLFRYCQAIFAKAGIGALSALLLVSSNLLPCVASAQTDGGYPVDATLMRVPAHRFATPAVNVKRPVRVAIVKYVRPAPNEEIVPASVAALRQYFGEDRVRVTHLSLTELADAIRRGEVDVFLSSAGFYRRLADEGVKSLVSAVSLSYPDPNHGDGTAIVTAADRTDIETLKDVKGGVLATSTPTAFTGLLVPYGEMMKQGFKVDGFFSETLYLGDDDAMETAPGHLLDGTADVAFLRLCFLEEWLERHPEHAGKFKVINRKDGPGEVCARSTALYPTWTVATTKVTDPRVSRSVTQALLALKPTGSNGIYWGVATDYSSVDKLFRDTRTGPRGVRRRGRRGRGRGDALRGGRTRDHHCGRRRRRDARDRRAPQQGTRLHEGRRARTGAFDRARHSRGLRRPARLQHTPSGRACRPRDRAREGGLRRAVAFG